jgi:hypothetical protein
VLARVVVAAHESSQRSRSCCSCRPRTSTNRQGDRKVNTRDRCRQTNFGTNLKERRQLRAARPAGRWRCIRLCVAIVLHATQYHNVDNDSMSTMRLTSVRSCQ